MQVIKIIFLIVWAFSFAVLGNTPSIQPTATEFVNPLGKHAYQTKGFNTVETEKLRNLLEKQIQTLNNYSFSPQLRNELLDTWQVFNESQITFSPLKEKKSKQVVAVASPFSDGFNGNETIFNGTIFLSTAFLDSNEFLFVFFHELKHLRDIQLAWKNKTKIKMLDSEQNSYRLHSLLALETKTRSLKIPVFGDSKMLSMTFEERYGKVSKEVSKFLKTNSFYKSLAKSSENDMDFSAVTPPALKLIAEEPMSLDEWTEGYLPPIRATPENISQNIQNRRQSSIKLLTSPKLSSPQELLKTALANELVVRKNLQDFAIELDLSLECFEKKQVKKAKIQEYLTPLNDGQFTFSNNTAEKSSIPCSESIKNHEFDISNIFWTHQNRELANSYFMRTEQLNGRLTAVYNFRPTSNVVSERVFIGTFYIDVEDAQIVKFYGEVQNRQTAHKAELNNLVTIWRRKSQDGIWLTSSVKSRGLLPKKEIPFSYEISFNYKMTDSDVKILDDTVSVATK